MLAVVLALSEKYLIAADLEPEEPELIIVLAAIKHVR
jgi:hypothetical protein